MEGLCPCGHEPTGSIVPVSVSVSVYFIKLQEINKTAYCGYEKKIKLVKMLN